MTKRTAVDIIVGIAMGAIVGIMFYLAVLREEQKTEIVSETQTRKIKCTLSYGMQLRCDNCSTDQMRTVTFYIPSGTKIDGYKTICPNCGLLGTCTEFYIGSKKFVDFRVDKQQFPEPSRLFLEKKNGI